MSINFSDLRPVIIDNLDAGISTEIKSAPGRGKSEFVESLIDHLSARDGFEWGFTTLFLATYTPQDLMGYMVPAKQEDGSIISKFTTPPWMITTDKAGNQRHINSFKRAIVFLDEYGQGDGDTKRVSAQLLLKGEVGPHKLGPGVGVIAASNRASDRSGVTKDFDFVINRRMEVSIADSIDAWKDWALGAGVSPMVLTFADQNPTIVFSDGVPEKQGPWCTPRSLVMADKLLQLKASRNNGVIPEDVATQTALAGLIGQGAMTSLMIFVKLEREMPKYEEIVRRPMETKTPTKPDSQMLVCYNLAHRVKPEDADAAIKYVERMPKEFAVTFATAAVKKTPAIVRTPPFQAWTKANSSLMASIATINSAR